MYKKNLMAAFNQAAITYDEAAVLYREVGERMLDRLEYVKLQPKCILDAGANTGHFSRVLAKKYPSAHIFSADIAEAMLRVAKQQCSFEREHYLGADIDFLPFEDHSMDLVFSDLVLQWSPDLLHSLRELQRLLTPEGVLIFSIYGPDTVQELRES